VFFGLTMEKLLVIGVIAVIIVGPERLPRYAEGFARFLGRAKEWLQGAKSRVRDEMGPEFDDVDWRRLDPRQYDPRRIIRDALLDDAPIATVRAASLGAAAAATGTAAAGTAANESAEPRRNARAFDAPNAAAPPFDSEAT